MSLSGKGAEVNAPGVLPLSVLSHVAPAKVIRRDHKTDPEPWITETTFAPTLKQSA